MSRGCGPSANNAADVVLWWRPPPGVETARPQQCMRYGWVFFRPPATRWTGQAQGGCSPLEDTRCSLCGRLCRRGVVAAPPPPPCRVELLPALGITGFRVRESRGPETRAGPGPAPGGGAFPRFSAKGVKMSPERCRALWLHAEGGPTFCCRRARSSTNNAVDGASSPGGHAVLLRLWPVSAAFAVDGFCQGSGLYVGAYAARVQQAPRPPTTRWTAPS